MFCLAVVAVASLFFACNKIIVRAVGADLSANILVSATRGQKPETAGKKNKSV